MDKETAFFVLFVVLIIIIPTVLICFFAWKPREITEVRIEELLNDKEKYLDKWINVSGYLEYVDKVSWTIILPHIWYTYDSDGNVQTHVGITIVEKELFLFHLHETCNEDSSFIYVVKETSGAYFPMFPLPFWYSPSWRHESMEKNVIYPELGNLVGIWRHHEVREHGKLWYVEV